MLGRLQRIILVLLVIHVSSVCLYYLLRYMEFSLPRSVKSIPALTAHTRSFREEPLILLPNAWHILSSLNFTWVKTDKNSELHLSNCPLGCRFSLDRARHEGTADMVILDNFYVPSNEFRRESILEIQKQVGQIWVGVTLESPYIELLVGRPLDGVYHWLSTYRRDSDIFWPYWSFTNRTEPPHVTPENKKYKKKLAAWLVSHCSTQSKREWLVDALQGYISVDVYGECGQPCPAGLDCRAYLAANYKFYLAFENSLCVDYVTEKLFLMLGQREGIVPVIYSWMNDTNLAPPNSYIDARDFKSVKDLAKYLQHLDKNDDEYNRYLQWKNDYEIVFETVDTKLCKACDMLLKYKTHLGAGGERMKRQPSILARIHSLGNGANYSYFKVAGKFIKTESVCFEPFANKASRDWLLDGKQLLDRREYVPEVWPINPTGMTTFSRFKA